MTATRFSSPSSPARPSGVIGELVGLGEREWLRDAFGAFVDPDLVERVQREGTDLAGEEVEVSILFMDIRGFTTYSEEVSAREAVALLNDLYERVVPIIARHGGHANKCRHLRSAVPPENWNLLGTSEAGDAGLAQTKGPRLRPFRR